MLLLTWSALYFIKVVGFSKGDMGECQLREEGRTENCLWIVVRLDIKSKILKYIYLSVSHNGNTDRVTNHYDVNQIEVVKPNKGQKPIIIMSTILVNSCRNKKKHIYKNKKHPQYIIHTEIELFFDCLTKGVNDYNLKKNTRINCKRTNLQTMIYILISSLDKKGFTRNHQIQKVPVCKMDITI